MIIKTLVENRSISEDFDSEHGFSLYIETNSRKILFDAGASELYLENAKKLNVDISDVDVLIISHGHNDHGGGIRAFLNENKKAKVYVNSLAFGKYYAHHPNEELKYIGLEEELEGSERIVFASDQLFISKGIQVFSSITQKEPPPTANSSLFMEQNGQIVKDTFIHEQNLIVEEDAKTLLIVGCAHNGIINILEHFRSLKGRMPDYVIGGFHLSSPSGGMEDFDIIEKIGKYLIGTRAKYYTCHCTGIEPYNRLKEIMGDSIDYLPAGSEMTI